MYLVDSNTFAQHWWDLGIWNGFSLSGASYLSAIIFILGLFAFLMKSSIETKDDDSVWPVLRTGFLALSVAYLLYVFLGTKLEIWQALSFMPWFLLFTRQIISKQTAFCADGLGSLISCGLIILQAGQLAPLVLGISYLYLYLVQPLERRLFTYEKVFVFVSLLLSFVNQLRFSAYNFPRYPAFARVLKERSWLSGTDPYVGAAPSIQMIDFPFIADSLVLPVLMLAVFCLLLFLGNYFKKEKPVAGEKLLLFLVLSLCLHSSLVPELVSQVSPIYTVSRLLPSLVLFNVSYIVLGFVLVLVSLLLVKRPSKILLSYIALCLLLAAFSDWPIVKRIRNHDLAAELIKVDSGEAKKALTQLVESPSYPLFQEFGLGLMAQRDFLNEVRWLPISALTPKLFASHNQTDIGVLLEANPGKRWGTLKGHQSGDEWIKVVFASEVELMGVRLLAPSFHSDYPRGLRVSLSQNDQCSNEISDLKLYNQVATYPVWKGSLKFIPSGYPYLDVESKVQIVFPQQKARCLLIEQIGKEPNYDWSVSMIQFGVRRNP